MATTSDDLWTVIRGDSPLVATAVHDGHDVRPEVAELLSLSSDERLREEDPHTGVWTAVAPTRLIAKRSRFEVDLNRSREDAVYLRPEDAWGLRVWREPPPSDFIERSLAELDAFHAEMGAILSEIVDRHGVAVVLDLHSYNHRRDKDGPPADPEGNPEVNIGTGTMDRERWAPLVDRFVGDLSAFDFMGRNLDVRENVKFMGRGLPRWVHGTFPDDAVALAIEFKKFFMDEWSGELDREQHALIAEALRSTIPGLLEESRRLAR